MANRRRLDEWLQAADPDCAAVTIDIDPFKRINDRFPHAVGDAVLRQRATPRRAARNVDDEFPSAPHTRTRPLSVDSP